MKRIIIAVIAFVLATCTQEEITSRSYPRIRTLPVNNITPEGATFHGEITFVTSAEIIDHGFIWSTSSNPIETTSEIVSLGTRQGKGHFETPVDRVMAEDEKYYVKAFVQTKDHLVYGEPVPFISLGSKSPEIESIEPKQGYWNDTISITGVRFGRNMASKVVRVGSAVAGIISNSPEAIRFLVPPSLEPGEHPVTVEVEGNRSAGKNFMLLLKDPVITGVSSDTVVTGQQVVISGQNFAKGFTTLMLGDQTILGSNIQVTSTSVTFAIQQSLPFGPARLGVRVVNAETVYEKGIYKAIARLRSISPASANYGDIISIVGDHFPADKNLLKVYFDDAPVEIIESSRQVIKVKVPTSLQRLKPVVKVVAEGQTATTNGFTLAAPKILRVDPAQHIKQYDNITIYGENLDGTVIVKVNGETIQGPYYNPSKNSIQIQLPYIIRQKQSVLSVERMGASESIQLPLMVSTVTTDTRSYRLSASVAAGDEGFFGFGSDCCPRYESKVYRFNPASTTFTEIANNTIPARGSPISFSLPGKVYFGGGGVYPSGSKTDLWEFDLLAGNWAQKNNLPASRIGIATATGNDNKVYGLFYTQDGPRRNELYQYDETNDSWTKISELLSDYRYLDSQASSLMSPCLMFFIGDDLYILGGTVFGSNAVNNTFYRFNIPTQQWKKLTFSIPLARDYYYLVRSAGRLFLLNKESSKTVFYEFDPATETFASKYNFATTINVVGSFTIGDIGYIIEENKILEFDATK